MKWAIATEHLWGMEIVRDCKHERRGYRNDPRVTIHVPNEVDAQLGVKGGDGIIGALGRLPANRPIGRPTKKLREFWETAASSPEQRLTAEAVNGALIANSPTLAKPSNPKDALGILKAPLSTVPGPVLLELGVAMFEGARKYGRHNYRVIGVRSSVYFDALIRHVFSWWEGEDTDPDSGLHHLTKAIATLVVLRDAMIQGKCVDDRPPASPREWIKTLNDKVKEIIAKYPDAALVYTEIGEADKRVMVEAPEFLETTKVILSKSQMADLRRPIKKIVTVRGRRYLKTAKEVVRDARRKRT